MAVDDLHFGRTGTVLGPFEGRGAAQGRERSCPGLTLPRALPARASPKPRTPSCSTRRCPASGFASTRRAGRSGSCRPASTDAAAELSSPGTGRCGWPPPAAAPRHARPHPRGTEPRRRHPKGEAHSYVREFTAQYLRCSDPHWKPSGRKTVRVYLKARILPAFGPMPLDRIGPKDVAAWFDAASSDKPGAANRALKILRAMLFRAEEWGLRKRDTNPCLGIAMNPRQQVARLGDAEELARLAAALEAHEACWPDTVAAIRLLALTGCRRGEVLDLRWRNIGAEALIPRRLENWPAHGTARRGRAGACHGVTRSTRSRRLRVPEPRVRQGLQSVPGLLASGVRRCRTRQPSPARPSAR